MSKNVACNGTRISFPAVFHMCAFAFGNVKRLVAKLHNRERDIIKQKKV